MQTHSEYIICHVLHAVITDACWNHSVGNFEVCQFIQGKNGFKTPFNFNDYPICQTQPFPPILMCHLFKTDHFWLCRYRYVWMTGK